jgi:hypothetical protein
LNGGTAKVANASASSTATTATSPDTAASSPAARKQPSTVPTTRCTPRSNVVTMYGRRMTAIVMSTQNPRWMSSSAAMANPRQREGEAEAVAQQHRIGTELGAQDGEPGVRQGRRMEALAPADRRAVAPGARRAPRQAGGLVDERGALAQCELDAAEGDDGADVVGTDGDAGALVDDGRVELLKRALERLSVRAYRTRVSKKGPHGSHLRHGLDGGSGAAAQRLGPLE